MSLVILDRAPPRLTAADHVFAHALACHVLPVVRNEGEEALVRRLADDLLPGLTVADPYIRDMTRAFAAVRAASTRAEEVRAEMDLRGALHGFNRWRMTEGLSALAGAR